jgi:hypothetical protein
MRVEEQWLLLIELIVSLAVLLFVAALLQRTNAIILRLDRGAGHGS